MKQKEEKRDLGIKSESQDISLDDEEKFAAVDKIIEKEYGDLIGVRGSCHELWAIRKRLLKELYDIDWKTPAERRRFTKFD